MRFLAKCFILLSCFHSFAMADALVRNQAMTANTIAQFFVEDEGVRLELEIGLDDVIAYKNLLPDQIYQDMGLGDTPWPDRLKVFFTDELAVLVEGQPLPARLRAIQPGFRIKRDEITGEALPVNDEEAEQVINATVFYHFDQQPNILYLKKQVQGTVSDVGFVLYHKGVAVNDFRYLSSGYELILDWQDPWYTHFSTKNLRRQYFAPMSGFLYVEPFEVRKEIIVRPKDLQRWVDLGLEGQSIISADQFPEIKAKVAEFLTAHQPVSINGEQQEGGLDRINFLERTLTSSRVIDPPEDLDIDAAVIGAIFVYPTETLPDMVEMVWDVWDERIQLVPVSAVDEAGPLAQYLQPDWNILKWENFLKNPTIPSLTVITTPPSVMAKTMGWLRWVFALLVVVAVVQLIRSVASGNDNIVKGVGLVCLLAGLTAIAVFVAKPATALFDGEDKKVVSGLLHNIYRAFDFREESDIYDVLDKSVSGDLLASIYLETRKSLVLANQGGAQAKVKTVEVQELESKPRNEGEGFLTNVTWVVTGSVGHWGHVHNRVNKYKAEMHIEPVEGVWKVVAMNVLEEERI